MSEEKSPSTEVLLRLHRLHQELQLSKTAYDTVTNLLVSTTAPIPPSTPQQVLWTEAVQANDIDLAWRTLCLLRHQGPLPLYAERLWQILGEGGKISRAWFPFSEKALALIVQSASQDAQSHLRAYFQLRLCLPVLFPSTPLSHATPPSSPPPRLIAKSQPWKKDSEWIFPRPSVSTWIQKKTQKKHPMPLLPPWVPLHAASSESAYVLSLLSEALGFSLWNWDITILQRQLQLASTQPHPAWRTLSASQQGACLVWSQRQPSFVSIEALTQSLSIILFQCALVILQDHSLWLETMAEWDVPAAWQKSMLQWIGSEPYSQIRVTSPHRFVLAVPPLVQQGLI